MSCSRQFQSVRTLRLVVPRGLNDTIQRSHPGTLCGTTRFEKLLELRHRRDQHRRTTSRRAWFDSGLERSVDSIL
jgi:hypothetical protein